MDTLGPLSPTTSGRAFWGRGRFQPHPHDCAVYRAFPQVFRVCTWRCHCRGHCITVSSCSALGVPCPWCSVHRWSVVSKACSLLHSVLPTLRTTPQGSRRPSPAPPPPQTPSPPPPCGPLTRAEAEPLATFNSWGHCDKQFRLRRLRQHNLTASGRFWKADVQNGSRWAPVKAQDGLDASGGSGGGPGLSQCPEGPNPRLLASSSWLLPLSSRSLSDSGPVCTSYSNPLDDIGLGSPRTISSPRGPSLT